DADVTGPADLGLRAVFEAAADTRRRAPRCQAQLEIDLAAALRERDFDDAFLLHLDRRQPFHRADARDPTAAACVCGGCPGHLETGRARNNRSAGHLVVLQ